MESILFYFLQALILLSALGMVCVSSPIYAALLLVLCMVGVAGIFVHLEAYFLAGVQLIVYAGAVTVLFVMVVMMFNLSDEKKAFAKGLLGNVVKVFTALMIWYTIAQSISLNQISISDLPKSLEGSEKVKELATHLFTKYVFGFEAICILLLVVIVGTVALSKARGGTHARSK